MSSRKELPLLCEDPDLKVRDKKENFHPGMSSAHPDVVQPAVVPKRDHAA